MKGQSLNLQIGTWGPGLVCNLLHLHWCCALALWIGVVLAHAGSGFWRDAVETYSLELLLVGLVATQLFSVQNCLRCRSCIISIFASYLAFLGNSLRGPRRDLRNNSSGSRILAQS